MQDELKNVLNVFNENKQQMIDIKKTPDVYITQTSTTFEVRNWLKKKQFENR